MVVTDPPPPRHRGSVPMSAPPLRLSREGPPAGRRATVSGSPGMRRMRAGIMYAGIRDCRCMNSAAAPRHRPLALLVKRLPAEILPSNISIGFPGHSTIQPSHTRGGGEHFGCDKIGTHWYYFSEILPNCYYFSLSHHTLAHGGFPQTWPENVPKPPHPISESFVPFFSTSKFVTTKWKISSYILHPSRCWSPHFVTNDGTRFQSPCMVIGDRIDSGDLTHQMTRGTMRPIRTSQHIGTS